MSVNITFLGGANTVTGSKYLVRHQSQSVLVDCGLFQGSRSLEALNYQALAFDPKSIDAVERCLQRITEAVIKIGPERMAQISPRTPVDAVRGLGNMLRHDYDKVDLAIIWQTITASLPELRVDCLKAIKREL